MQIFFCFVFLLVNISAFSQAIDPYKFLATLQFDSRYNDFFVRKHEQVFPIAFNFNGTQDGNGNGRVDAEDACENSIQYAVGDSIYGTGRTDLIKRGPNDQRPVVYFHFCKWADYDVYEYWLYYVDNDYLNDHEHDWEKYFIYVKDGKPLFVRMSNHKKFKLFYWDQLQKDDGHIIIGVHGGSHAMDVNRQDGVQIRHNGDIAKRSGRLDVGDGKNFPWRIVTNDVDVMGAINYIQKPDCFYNGDPVYFNFPPLFKNKENKNCSNAPWIRTEWNDPSIPSPRSKMNIAITIGN